MTHVVNFLLYMRYDGIIIFSFIYSDGAASHFKNNYTLMNLLYHKKDFDLEAAWTFSLTGHGKDS